VHDSQVFEQLVDRTDEAVFADSAYFSKASDEHLIANDCQNFIMSKAGRGRPLTEEEQTTNKLRSRIRVRGEHVFGRMAQMAMDRLRTIGLLRAGQHNGLCNLVYNMDRYAFLCR
ncbi:MAG: transposase, partial [Opitutales bacterium]